MRQSALRVGLLVASLALSLAVAELGLRAAGFSFAVAPSSVVFGWPRPVTIEERYRADPDVFWLPRDYEAKLAGLAATPPDIVFLGDSCTEFGAYPALLLERLQRDHPERRFVGGALGVTAWSSYQGLHQLERDVLPLRPRSVSFYYGWNDHWVGFGVEDDEVAAMGLLHRPQLASLRLVQLAFKAQIALRAQTRRRLPTRVPPEDFRVNLREMARRTRAAGAVPVLLTAPSSHERGREPAYLAGRYLADLDDLVPLHQRYVQIVRELAQAEDALLCDLAARFDELPRRDVRSQYFLSDGIHLTPWGNARLAEFLYQCFAGSDALQRAWSPEPRG